MSERPQDYPEQAGSWFVAIEENYGDAWKVTGVQPFATRDEAMWHAVNTARGYVPKSGLFKEKTRWIMQVGQDSWLVVIGGKHWNTHFRISVGRQVW
ncbi:hypothetical protein [Actinocrispum wychmicini]|uniref:Uncharacterized protein n=1 Tax=Actinocrispum wychmicini TaxID=1213861 RepID=A0A4R2JFS8_9PSEU|nr:hypothetical protein [Actinocrispum wychmicini]TCO58611.1 hypothetical protein EV192_105682 [Actinocrispum wychmicini]